SGHGLKAEIGANTRRPHELVDLGKSDTDVHRSLTPEYLKINPNGVVPTLVHDGTIIVESTVIIHYLDDLFPDPPLMPRAPLDRTRAHLFKKLMDEYIHPACIVYTFATANRGRFA